MIRTKSWRTRATWIAALALALPLAASGCAYFNTFYTAKKSFNEAQKMYVTPDQRATPGQMQAYDRAIRGATKVVVEYPDSKWVDDAVLMMGRSLLGKGDYDGARLKFEELRINFPDSPLGDQGMYYHGEAYRLNREFASALNMYDSLYYYYPKSKFLNWANLQRGKIAAERRDYERSVEMLVPLLKTSGDDLYELDLHHSLASAYLALEAWEDAEEHFHWVADHAKTEELVHEAKMKEGACLEARDEYQKAIYLYRRWHRTALSLNYQDEAKIRMGYAQALSGDIDEGIETLERVIAERRRTPAAAQALFQIGYIQEVLLDDFKSARDTYSRVPQESGNSTFAQQATTRMANLDKLEELRASLQSDSTGVDAAAAAAFSVAEHYLFEANNPQRALTEYSKVEMEYGGTAYAEKAAFAGAWVLERKLLRPEAADSAWKHVAETYPNSTFGRAASAFRRGRIDSLRSTDPLEQTLVSYPLTPGAAPYVPPVQDIRIARSERPATNALPDSAALADSLRLETMRARAAAGAAVAADSLADSLGVEADSAAVAGEPPDTLAAKEEAPVDTAGTQEEEAASDTTQNQDEESDAPPDTTQSGGP